MFIKGVLLSIVCSLFSTCYCANYACSCSTEANRQLINLTSKCCPLFIPSVGCILTDNNLFTKECCSNIDSNIGIPKCTPLF